jgi:hypothetical protein
MAHENRIAAPQPLPSMMSVLTFASPLGYGFSRSVGLNSGHNEKVRWNSDRRGNMNDVNCAA